MRLLVLEDRREDAERLISRKPIQSSFPGRTAFLKSVGDIPPKAELDNYSIIVAQTLRVASELIKAHKFDFVITDLMLFDPDEVNKISLRNYFSQLALEDLDGRPGRRSQIIKPTGLSFLRELRQQRETEGTRRAVPAIAMTFFWRHPRFDAFYLEEIRNIGGMPVGYLPKYYWENNQRILNKGDAALGALIDLLQEA